ncbi:MAG: S-layer homology domain-containing protein [Oscillospiraceae bacterium]|jgi:hypothetical protein|nr:S-layer homology domain-containing protein [Oscillospiraceae bacterium]
MQQSPFSFCRAWKKRGMSLFLALVLVLGLFPGVPGLEGEASAHWADPYLSQLVEWGFIRSDQAGYPDRALTRADFMAITNRAYGYHETGETPFEDVDEKDWYYDDVGIAYTARYIKGTSPTTASPKSTLTRETAATILGRNMMLQESAGELLDFADARQISSWAKGTVKSSLEHYLVSGYDDGTFRPQRNVSWGEMAAMVTNLIGTPLQEPGDYTLGGTFGNVTITSPGVTLRDTVISGDLYVTGGVGLGDVKLENVTVLGRIIASGAGSSEGGGASILLRNVIADELLVDNLQDNPVSVKADGITEIGHTTVRTTAFIEDNTPDGMGLRHISLEGESYPEGEEPEDWEPPVLTLAGRIEEVVNKTPNSTVHAASGTVAKLTVDEAAEGSAVVIDRNTVVKELNLDTTTTVTGEGDVGKLVVNAPGCVVEMLPDEIEIRPGITAEINGEEMDSVAAQESSEEPQILAGYPEARDIIPTGLDAVFMTNKAGTVYWAVSAITDGSVGEEDLIKPPSYGNIAVSNGSLNIAKGNEETIAKVGKLTPGGSYYLSAVLVDARDKRSTTKVISFTTPDNTTPAFCAGYPKMSKVSRTDSVVVVMPNKDCKLYYALLPEGATAPTENELKTSSVAGALGYGVRDVKKNVEDAFRVNDVILDETTNYVLYLWLVDADGVNKGKIVTLKFTTDDETPPEFIQDPTPEKIQATSVSLKFQLSEPGTVYWVAFPSGSVKNYPKPQPGTDYESAPLNSDYAIQQVVNGMNIGSEGKSGQTSVKANKDGACIGTFNITGMKPETTYDVYYVAKDNAGPDRNYSVTVKHITVSPQDDKGPVFTQSFELTAEGDEGRPRSNSAIYLDVSEDVYFEGQGGSKSLLELYKDTQTGSAESKVQAVNRLAEVLYKSIVLHKYDIQSRREESIYRKYQTGDTRDDWVIDYTKATVESRDEGGIRITFPAEGLQLQNGGQYCFTINDLTDLAGNGITPEDGVDFWDNATQSAAAGHNVKPFIVEAPWIRLGDPIIGTEFPMLRENGVITNNTARADMFFSMEPQSTSSVAETTCYDILLWSRTPMKYDLYYRVLDASGPKPAPLHTSSGGVYAYPAATPDGATNYLLSQTENKPVDENGWIYLGNSSDADPLGEDAPSGRSVSKFFNGCDTSNFGQLRNLNEKLEYQFVIMLTENHGKPDYGTWTDQDTARIDVNVAAGQSPRLNDLAGVLSYSRWTEFQELGPIRGAESIGRWMTNEEGKYSDTQNLSCDFELQTLPKFMSETPTFTAQNDGSMAIRLSLSSAGVVHYAISPVNDKTKGPDLTTTRKLMAGTDDYKADGTVADNVQPVNPTGTTPTEMYITTTGPRPPQKGGTSLAYPMLDWMENTGGSTIDNPPKNEVTSPTPNIITTGKFGSEVVASGKFTPQENATTPLYITGDSVKPGRTYFAYFVITGTGSSDLKSQVYIYQFTMPAPKKPSILPSTDSEGNAKLSIDMLTEDDGFIITTYSNATNGNISILTKAFSTYSDYPITGDKGKMPDCYNNYTVLEALTTPYSYRQAKAGDKDPESGEFYYPDYEGDRSAYDQGYTVFDMYASDHARNHIYTLILSQMSLNEKEEQVNVPKWGPKNPSFDTDAPDVKKGEKRKVTELKNEDGQSTGKDLAEDRYILLAYAKNPDMKDPNSSDNSDRNTFMIASFTALVFRKGKMQPPEVINASAGATPFTKDSGLGNTYSGSVHIEFKDDVYLKGSNNKIDITEANLLGNIKFASGTVSVSNVSDTSFDLDFKNVKAGETLRFPRKYFANEANEGADETELRITVTEKEIVIEWDSEVGKENGSPWKIPLQDSTGGDYTLLVRGDDLGGTIGANRSLTLNATSTSGQITAEFEPKLTNPNFTWTIPNTEVIQLSGTGSQDKVTGGNITIKAIKPGTVTVTLKAYGEDATGAIQSAEGSITVVVTGELTLNPVALTFAVNDKGVSTPASSTVTVTVTGGTPDAEQIDVTPRSNNLVSYNVTGNTITFTPTNRVKPNSAPVTFTVGLKAADGTDLTPSNSAKKTVTINFTEDTSTTFSTNTPSKVTAQKPTLTLSTNSVTLDMGSSTKKQATVAVKSVTPSGSAVAWKSANENIATVSGGTITAKSIGTTTVTATVTTPGGTVTKTVSVKVTDSVTGLTLESSTGKKSADWTGKELTLYRGSSTSGNTMPTATFTVKTGAPIPSNAQVYCAVTDANGKELKTNYITCERTSGGKVKVTVKGGAPEGTALPVKVTLGLEAKTGGADLTAKLYTFTVKVSGSDSGIFG